MASSSQRMQINKQRLADMQFGYTLSAFEVLVIETARRCIFIAACNLASDFT